MKVRLTCPKCHNKMQYENRTAEVLGKKKTCVYCGANFTITVERIDAKLS